MEISKSYSEHLIFRNDDTLREFCFFSKSGWTFLAFWANTNLISRYHRGNWHSETFCIAYRPRWRRTSPRLLAERRHRPSASFCISTRWDTARLVLESRILWNPVVHDILALFRAVHPLMRASKHRAFRFKDPVPRLPYAALSVRTRECSLFIAKTHL